jgi:ribosomal protein L11 methyltransferase
MAWQRLGLVVAGEHAQALADALEARGALSTDLSDADAGTEREQALFGEPGADTGLWPRCRLVALFDAGADVSSALDAALADAAGPQVQGASFDRLEDADWVALTQQQFAPVRAGERLWIVPTWHEAPDAHAVNIVLDPGAAFGTGSHPTTRLCLAWLERHVRPGDAVLDYGCGSGILAIAALKLGAGRAIAVDVDPLALQAARYNASRNAVALEVRDAQQDIAEAVGITVANILANPLRMLAPLLASRTRPGGSIALSGILEAQAGAVIAAYAPWAALHVAAREAGWVLLAGERATTR